MLLPARFRPAVITTTAIALVMSLTACGAGGTAAESSTPDQEPNDGMEIPVSQSEWSLSGPDALIDVAWIATLDGEPVSHDNCTGFYSEHAPARASSKPPRSTGAAPAAGRSA